MPNRTVGTYRSIGHKNNTARREFNIRQVLKGVQKPKHYKHQAEVRKLAAVTDFEIQEQKQKLADLKAEHGAVATPHGVFDKRKTLDTHSGLMYHDIDKCFTPDTDEFTKADWLEELLEVPHVYAAGMSLTGLGISVLCGLESTPETEEQHERAWAQSHNRLHAAVPHLYTAEDAGGHGDLTARSVARAWYVPCDMVIYDDPKMVYPFIPLVWSDTETVIVGKKQHNVNSATGSLGLLRRSRELQKHAQSRSKRQFEPSEPLTFDQVASVVHLPISKGDNEVAGPCPCCGGTDRFHMQEADNKAVLDCRKCGKEATGIQTHIWREIHSRLKSGR